MDNPFKYIFSLFMVAAFTVSPGEASPAAYPDVKILAGSEKSLTIEYSLLNFKMEKVQNGQELFRRISFWGARYQPQPGKPLVPYRLLKIGLPPGAKPTVYILNEQTQTFSQVDLLPGPTPIKDRQGIAAATYRPDALAYQHDSFLPQKIARLHTPTRFRDIRMQELELTPVQYNASTRQLLLYKKIRLRIDFNAPPVSKHPFQQRGKLDALYSDMLLNFQNAKHWQRPLNRRLSRPEQNVYLPEGTWYRMTVQKDGLYKITPSDLSASGIDIANLPINSLQMFNNGGHMLNIKISASDYNPPFTQEIPIFIQDRNGNGLFDGNDFLLFYGKAVNGWFYDYRLKDFAYQEHLYAKENVYWLTVKGTQGLRMSAGSLSAQPQAVTEDFFYDRFHFEKDEYNLLGSGPDWYGRRFYGRSDSYSINFSLNTDLIPGAQAAFRIRFKGGAGIEWDDNGYYRYTFNVSLNNQALIPDFSFNNSSLKTVSKEITDSSILKKGRNTLALQYTGNKDACIAYLDWFEVYYPRNFTASENSLRFFTKDFTQAQHYTIAGLSSGQDIYVFDITDPVHPLLLAEKLQVVGGAVQFDLPPSNTPKEILVTGLSSAKIKDVGSLTPVQRGQDLISSGNQADYLIITAKSFLPYARQMAELRPQLSSKIVTMDEIYFEFNSGVPDPTAIRNFIRRAYYNWRQPAPSYVLLFGDGHYDYRHIILPDSIRVPPYEIFSTSQIYSRTTDNYFVDMDYNGDAGFNSISPDLAIGRLPLESVRDAQVFLEKIKTYENNPADDGWQTVITFVADDNIKPKTSSEWMHQNDTEDIANLPQLRKFNEKKIYLSTYPSKPGGFGRVKPQANDDLIDALNEGTLIVNYMGHGKPTQWAHENVFNMERDLGRINNPGKLPLLIAATCDFGKFDNPHDPTFTEALFRKKESGIIAALAFSRLVFSDQNAAFNSTFFSRLFPGGKPSKALGEAKLLSTGTSVNDQKFILFADPTMHLADPREKVRFTAILPDTLKALSEATVQGDILVQDQFAANFSGEAFLIVNDARYDSVKTGAGFHPVTFPGPLIFKGQISVKNGKFTGHFIVPRSIRYKKKPTGRLTVFAYDEQTGITAMGYNDHLLFTGSAAVAADDKGPDIDVYFENNENFSSGDLISANPVLLADLSDENGINVTGQAGHKILLQIDDQTPRNISGFFSYEKNSFRNGQIRYPLDRVSSGEHKLRITAFDNLNNLTQKESDFRIASASKLVLEQVVNYPNPFRESTAFTFQTNRSGAQITIKIYTLSGRLIEQLEDFSVSGYNDEISWNGRDRDGDELANGVYLYKIILKDGKEKKEKIEKLVIMR